MTPNDLINGLRYLAEQCPVEAVCFRVPSAPSCTDHNMRLDVTPRDILDLLECIALTQKTAGMLTDEGDEEWEEVKEKWGLVS